MSSFVFSLCLAMVVTGGQQSGEAHWTTNYATALKAARQTHKPLLVVIENPTVADQRVDRSPVESDPARSAQLNRYQLCRVDATTAYGRKVAKAFKATTLPLTAVSDKNSKILLFRKTGAMTSQDWTTALNTRTAVASAPAAPAANSGAIQGAPVLYDSGTTVPFGSTYLRSYCPSCNRGASSGWYIPYYGR